MHGVLRRHPGRAANGHTRGVHTRPDLIAAASAGLPPSAGPRHQILFHPSFHHPSLLTLDLGPAPGVHLRAFTDHRGTNYTDTRVALKPTRAEQARRDLERHAPALALPDDRRGLDGISLHVAIADADAFQCFAAWSPDRDMPVHAYFAAVHALATEVLAAADAQRRLEQLHGYLALGLPVRDRGGYPRGLQIFGRLSSSDEAALVAWLAAVDPAAAVVVDMRNFEGMGTLLYPVFRRFARRPGPLAWAVSPIARRQLREAQVPADQLLDDLADAVLRVTVRDARR